MLKWQLYCINHRKEPSTWDSQVTSRQTVATSSCEQWRHDGSSTNPQAYHIYTGQTKELVVLSWRSTVLRASYVNNNWSTIIKQYCSHYELDDYIKRAVAAAWQYCGEHAAVQDTTDSNRPTRTVLKLTWERSNATTGSRVWPTSRNGTEMFCSEISNLQKDSTSSRDEDTKSKCIWTQSYPQQLYIQTAIEGCRIIFFYFIPTSIQFWTLQYALSTHLHFPRWWQTFSYCLVSVNSGHVLPIFWLPLVMQAFKMFNHITVMSGVMINYKQLLLLLLDHNDGNACVSYCL